MTERQFQSQVVKVAKLNGWLVYHTFDSRRSEPGFPDLVLVKGERVIFAELKSEQGRVRPEQVEWLERLSVAKEMKAVVWRPSELKQIVKSLGR